MKQNLHKRLGKLEVVSAAARRAREAKAKESALEATIARLRELLRSHGIEQQPHESFANTLARGLGISDSELYQRLRTGTLDELQGARIETC